MRHPVLRIRPPLLSATAALQIISLLSLVAVPALARLPVGHPHRPCLNLFRRQPVNRAAGVARVSPLLHGVAPGFYDGLPTPFEAPNGQQAVFCLLEKAGSTRWKQLLLKAVDGSNQTVLRKPHLAQVHPSGKPPWPPSKSEYPTLRALRNASVSRIVIVRSPYSRLLSAYLNKLAKGKWGSARLYKKFWTHTSINASSLTASPSDFAAFVEDLHRLVQRFGWEGSVINKHFVPISRKCGIDVGLQYDYALPVEWIESWYPALVNMLGLQDVVRTGWRELSAPRGKTAPQPSAAPRPDCFYTAKHQTCEEMQQLIESPVRCSSDKEAEAKRRAEQGMDIGFSGAVQGYERATNADGLLHQYYTSHLAQLVEELFARDFQEFQFERLVLKEWNLPPLFKE